MTAHPTNRPSVSSIERGILLRIRRDGAQAADEFGDPDIVESLRARGLIFILSDGRLGLSMSSARLLDAPADEAAAPPQSKPVLPEHPQPAPKPLPPAPAPTLSAAGAALLRRVADAGGETRFGSGGAPGRSLKLLYDARLLEKTDRGTVALTPSGVRWLDQHPTAPAPVEVPPVETPLDDDDVPREALTSSSPLSIADSANGLARAEQAAPNGVQAFAEALTTFSVDTRDGIAALDHALGDVYADHWQRCEICPSGSPHCVNLRALDFLLEHAPALRSIYDHLVQLDADRARLADALRGLGA